MTGRRNNQNTKGAEIAKLILDRYQPESKEDVQDAFSCAVICTSTTASII